MKKAARQESKQRESSRSATRQRAALEADASFLCLLLFVLLFCFALLRRSELSSVLFGLCREAGFVCVGCWRLCSVVARILSGKVALRVALSGVASCLALLVVVVAVVVVVVTLIHLVVVVVGILGR